jgi:hypothetical protein
MAAETALKRAQFEMNCPEATSAIISREVIQPALQGAYVGGDPAGRIYRRNIGVRKTLDLCGHLS